MLPRSTVVHIGSGKAGSSAIRRALVSSRQHLADLGWHVFVTAEMRDINRHCLAYHLDHHTPSESHLISSRLITRTADPNQVILDFRRRVEATDRPNLLISNEFLSDVHPERLQKRLAVLGRLIEGIDDVTIVYYVRRPDSLFVSLYLQWFLPEVPVTIADFMGDFDFSGPGPNKLTIDWHANCRAIREAFPHARLVVRSVEEAGDELIADFWRTCGLGVPPETAPERRANVSLGIIPYFAMRALFKHLPVRPRRKVYALLRRVNIRTRWDKSLFLRDEDRQRIRAFYHGAYVDLRDEFGVDLLS